MSWIQDNKVPAAILGLSAVGVAGLGFVLFSSYSSYSENIEQFNTLNQRIAALNSAALAPTPENLALKQNSVKEFTDAAGKLGLVLNTLESQVAGKPTTETDFQAKLKNKIADIKKVAAESRVQLPAEFNLAFDRYNSELPKSAAAATELAEYLDAVDAVVRLLIESGVERVDMLERSELAAEKGEVATPPTPARGPARPGARQPAGKPAAPPPPKLTDRRQIRLVLGTDQGALQQLMSKLASPSEMPYFTVVRLLRVENERQEGPLRADTVLRPAALTDGGLPAAAPTAGSAEAGQGDAKVKPAPPDAVAVLGREKLRVFLELDWVKFLTAKTAAK